MTEINCYKDEDLIKRLNMPKDFPKDEKGRPDPDKAGISSQEMVYRYHPKIRKRYRINSSILMGRVRFFTSTSDISKIWL